MIENEQLLEYVGETFTEKLRTEIAKYYLELKKETFGILENNLTPMSMVHATEKDSTEIKAIGCSCVHDLFTDNFGRFYSSILGGNPTSLGGMKDTGGTTRSLVMYAGATTNKFNQSNVGTGTFIQIGQGITPAQRTDFNVETAFVGGVEASLKAVGGGGYNSGLGQVSFAGTISPMSQAGQVSEVCFYNKASPPLASYLLARDNISPVVGVGIGDSVNVSYIIQLS